MTPDPRTAAITGIGCRLPGGVRGPAAFWDLLLEGRDAVAPIPAPRWEQMRTLLAEEDRTEAPWRAGVIDIDAFDHGFFKISAEEAAELDPQQRLGLEVAVEALDDAGIPLSTVAGSRTGIYAGCAAMDHAMLRFAPGQRPGMLAAGGVGLSMLAARTAHHLDTRGPALTIDAACSSSLVAAHYARRDLEAGDVDTAVVIGANLIRNPLISRAFTEGGVLSPQGRCAPFDAAADGYVRSEAVVALILRRHHDTTPGSDRVYALLAASAVNSDGKSRGGVFAPNPDTQAALLTEVYAQAGIQTDRIGYVEAHGTGTKAGDRTEAEALAAAFDRDPADPLRIGSVKSNLGHTEGAAGLAGLIKAALIAHHGEIPPTLHHTAIRPALKDLALTVPTRTTPLPGSADGTALVGVSSFGFGGTNAHAALTQPPAPPSPTGEEEGGPAVLALSTHAPHLLAGTAADTARHLGDTADLHAAAALSATGRDHGPHRAAVITATPAQARDALHALASDRPHPTVVGPHHPRPEARVVFVFPGQAAHDPSTGTALAERFPVFRDTVAHVQEAMARYPGHVPWRPGATPAGVAALQQAAFTVQVGLAALWRSHGVHPDLVVGHSLGEIAAAHTAGALTLEDAALLVCARSRHLAAVAEHGGLLATGLTRPRAEGLRARVGGRVVIAAANAPHQTVLSGPEVDLDHLQADLEAERVFARRVVGAPPAHSPLLETRLGAFAAEIGAITPTPGQVAMVSTVTGHLVDGTTLDAAYWIRQLRAPVEAHTAVRTAAREQSLFLEVGTRPVLAGAITDTLAHHRLPGTITALSGDDEYTGFLAAAAELFTRGHTPAWPVAARRRPAFLPPRRWNHHPPVTANTESASSALTAALSTAPPAQRRAILADTVHAAVAPLLARPPALDERDTPLDDLGLDSRDHLVLRARLAGLHPALHHLDAAAIAHAPTIQGIADALLPLLPATDPTPDRRRADHAEP
ncbi:acyl transferase domain-containing protein [Murinocardiopsis flavida]|uniref:Acyl transferase domain-containing protein n=1 Tax=Murinocardiopsis flavida TaxID=645275 RepID=A0A2P8DG78_9ACTN|nr:type I polyketide synthase [Murinocardiopsis flavida]PSK96208.1 acyl transferase domain-containing protein [Murinocardiopsis flavida]